MHLVRFNISCGSRHSERGYAVADIWYTLSLGPSTRKLLVQSVYLHERDEINFFLGWTRSASLNLIYINSILVRIEKLSGLSLSGTDRIILEADFTLKSNVL